MIVKQAQPTKTPRRKQADRSQQTREALLKATIDTLLEHGYAGLTTAQVDARAAVSSGARVHHYPAKVDLVIAATEYTYARMTELGQRRADAARQSSEPLRHFVEDCLSIYFDWPFVSAVEIVMTARTDPALMSRLRPVLQKFHTGMRETWTDALVDAGYSRSDAETCLGLTLNLIRGMALNRIWQNDNAEYKRLIEVWCRQLHQGFPGPGKPGAAGQKRGPAIRSLS